MADGATTSAIKRKWLPALLAALALAAVLLFGYARWSRDNSALRGDLLQSMPADASAVIYADAKALRQSPFLAEIYSWAPGPQADADYAQFVGDTGFDYERDLDRVAIAVEKSTDVTSLFAIAEGRFDRKKISAFALKNGASEKRGGHEIFNVTASGNLKRISLTFLSDSRIALTDDVDITRLLAKAEKNVDSAEWRARFERVAGAPVFAVIRQDAGAGDAIAAQAPGSLRSPQLSALLDQLQWITLAGKPDADHLRVVVEGESRSEDPARKLGELLNGVILMAQEGLNEPKTRQQLDPQARAAYLDLLKTAEVSQVDRGATKSVRLIFDVAPQFLKAARIPPPQTFTPAPAQQPPAKLRPKKTSKSN